MADLNDQQVEIIRRSQQSVSWFLNNFGKLKHPSAGVLPFQPFSYQKHAIKCFRKNRLNIFRKCRQCFRGDQMVWGPCGPRRIDSIKPGDEVYSYNLTTQRLDIVRVQEIFDNGEREVCEVQTKTGHKSVTTLDHNYFTYDGQLEAQKLTDNDRLLEVNDWPRVGAAADHSEAILLGYLIADGYYGRGNSNQGHFTNTCWRYLLEFQKHFHLFHGLRRPIKPHNKDDGGKVTSYRIYSANNLFWDWLEGLGIAGQTKEHKTIPDKIFSWDNDSVAVFLNRLFAVDGWYSGRNCNEVGIGQESMIMLHQIKQLLSRFDIDAKVYPVTDTSMPKLRIYGGKNFKLFVENIGIFNKEPRKEITKGFFFNRKKGDVKEVICKGETAKVYDLKVPPHDNYIIDGVVVHNSGISKISGAFATWFAMFHPHKTILIVSRRNEDAMGFLRDHVVFLYEHLPPWMKEVWKPIKQNEHEIIFPNGSRIQSLTSHPEVLRSNASSLNIIDEAAFIQGMDGMWAAGWPCQSGNTLIQTDDGLHKIESFDNNNNEWQDLDINVATDGGYKHCDKLHVPNGGTLAPTIKLTTKLGFINEGTPHHKLRTINKNGDYVWKKLCNFKNGDIVISKPGQFEGKRKYLSNGLELCPKLAELIGLYVGDGTIYASRPKRLKICFDPKDHATKDCAIQNLNTILTKINNPTSAYSEIGHHTIDLRLNSAPFIDLLCGNGLKSKTCAKDAEIPTLILSSDRAVACAFLRGLFDSDGWCYQSSTCLKLGFSTQSAELVSQVQVLLHSLGIMSKISRSKNHKNMWGKERAFRLDILDGHSKELFKEIGFITQRKQMVLSAHCSTNTAHKIDHQALVGEFLNELHDKTLCLDKSHLRTQLLINISGWKRKKRIKYSAAEEMIELCNLTSRLSQFIKSGFYFDKVKTIKCNKTKVFDLSVPNNNTYLANGFVSHNTLQHGGNVIVISTSSGLGNWYWSTWTDAEAGLNGFNPIFVNWWDMDWAIEYRDPLSLNLKRIAPRDGIRKSTAQEMQKFGPYWSPWLQEQYNALQVQGDAWKFDQEILALFIGSGNTVLSKEVLSYTQTTVKDPLQKVSGYQAYVHPVSGIVEDINFDFEDSEQGLWVWKKPVVARSIKKRGNVVIDQGAKAHAYAMGVDIATGKGRDFSAIEVFDVDTMEQVAEFMARCLPRELIRYIDRIGRWYNCALAVVERNNGGDTLIDSLRYDVMYPRIWRKKEINDKPQADSSRDTQRALKVSQYGFSTSMASKPTLNKFLIDCISDKENEGYAIFSTRLLKQLQIYVRKRDRTGRDTNKTEAEDGAGNHDDLVIACALALLGTSDAFTIDAGNLLPVGSGDDFSSQTGPTIFSDAEQVSRQQSFVNNGGASLLMPMVLAPEEMLDVSIQCHIDSYTLQLGGIPIGKEGPIVTPDKYYYTRK